MKAAALLLSLALLAGCATPTSVQHAGLVVIPAPTVGRNPGWTPTAEEVAKIERAIAHRLANPDQRVFGLGQNLPPYPYSEYLVRCTAAGPLDNRFVMGIAALPSSVSREEFLSPATPDTRAVELAGSSPANFQFIYNLKQDRLVEIRFNKQPGQP